MIYYYTCTLSCVQGMLRSRGRRLLFADADGATKFADIEKLEAELAKLKLTSQVGDSTISSNNNLPVRQLPLVEYFIRLTFNLLSNYFSFVYLSVNLMDYFEPLVAK